MHARRAIGILGGVGPYAGLDLMRKIFDNTRAQTDQEHLPVLHFCYPNLIMGRPAFLDGLSPVNPGDAIGDIMIELAKAGADVLGMPCNTAHCPAILDKALERLEAYAGGTGPSVRFVHMIDEVARRAREDLPSLRTIGVLGSSAVCRTNVYQTAFTPFGVSVIYPEPALRDQVQRAVLDESYGIKAESNPVSGLAVRQLEEAGRDLIRKGAEAIVLGCTEIPLALTGKTLDGVPLIDATDILAKALISAFCSEKLKK